MASLITSARLSLLLLSAIGFYTTWFILLNNGTYEYMAHIRDFGPRLLPGTKEPLKRVYVGVPAIDYQLTVLAVFFWEQVDGSHPEASLFCFHFATQAACGWGLLLIEAYRNGNQWRSISFIGVWGVLVQNFAYAVVLPIYFVVHLLTSPMISPTKLGFVVPSSALQAVPLAMTIGYVLPTVLMSLPAPSVIDFEQKQIYMAIWQMFPLWVSIAQETFTHAIKLLNNKEPSKEQSKSPTSSSMGNLRVSYIGLLIVAGIGQIAAATLITVSAFFPDIFSIEFRGVFNASKVFLPAAISPSTKMPSIGSGSHMLLQYDEAVGSLAMMVWSTVLFFNVYRRVKPTKTSGYLIGTGTAAFILTGPLGYAVACIWARDEMIQSDLSENVPAEDMAEMRKTN